MKLITERLKFVLVGSSIKCKIEVRALVFTITANKYILLMTSEISLQSRVGISEKSQDLFFFNIFFFHYKLQKAEGKLRCAF